MTLTVEVPQAGGATDNVVDQQVGPRGCDIRYGGICRFRNNHFRLLKSRIVFTEVNAQHLAADSSFYGQQEQLVAATEYDLLYAVFEFCDLAPLAIRIPNKVLIFAAVPVRNRSEDPWAGRRAVQ